MTLANAAGNKVRRETEPMGATLCTYEAKNIHTKQRDRASADDFFSLTYPGSRGKILTT